jgi:hypothetical protein
MRLQAVEQQQAANIIEGEIISDEIASIAKP